MRAVSRESHRLGVLRRLGRSDKPPVAGPTRDASERWFAGILGRGLIWTYSTKHKSTCPMEQATNWFGMCVCGSASEVLKDTRGTWIDSRGLFVVLLFGGMGN